LFIHITLETAPNQMQCDVTNSHMVTAGRSNFDLSSGYSRPTLGRSYFDLYFELQQADHISILFRVTAGRSYFGLQQADLISALGETRA